ncbi:putative uncharacterized protein BRD3OS [Latimeria chalumnae]|uniref:putative uncharacterized protein BRD3OS n=1 Tax=Latimeria chalumnae TaxID=7897 RepID=UPI00313C3F1E
MSGGVSLAGKALSEGYTRLRYQDTSLIIWQQQQQNLETSVSTYLSRSQSMWYKQHGNQAILVRDKTILSAPRNTGQSTICTVM